MRIILILVSLISCLLRHSFAATLDHGSHRRATPAPKAISITPAENWDGIDGQWNSFYINVGTPPQLARVFASTASQQTWVVLQPQGCSIAGHTATCAEDRGGLFNPKKSKTWDSIGTWSFSIEENLGFSTDAEYGFDTVSLGSSVSGSASPTVKNTTVAAFAAYDYYLGAFGLNPKSTNFTEDLSDSIPSWMSRLRDMSQIPSLSWGYTAGMPYEGSTGVLASLTLGGYDESRFTPNDVEFFLGSDNERDIVVNLKSITLSNKSQKNVKLLSSPIYTYIDSTVPQIWLPKDACDAFEKAFGLQYDDRTDLYFISKSAQRNLEAQNPSVTFALTTESSSSEAVNIHFPWAAFSHTAKAPYQGLTHEQLYFPLRRAENDTQYTLGRAFLQEAYLTVDWERRNFSVSQAVYTYGESNRIISVSSPDGDDESPEIGPSGSQATSTSVSAGVIAGVVVAIIAALVIAVLLILFLRRRRRNLPQRLASVKSTQSSANRSTMPDVAAKVFPKAELDATEAPRSELDGKIEYYTPKRASNSAKSPMQEAEGVELYEMMGDLPPEADGRSLGEKEAMVHRAGMYNGVDTIDSTESGDGTHDSSTTERRRLAPVNPEDVVEVSQRNLRPKTSPVGSLTPMDAADMDRMAGPMPSQSAEETDQVNRKRFSYED